MIHFFGLCCQYLVLNNHIVHLLLVQWSPHHWRLHISRTGVHEYILSYDSCDSYQFSTHYWLKVDIHGVQVQNQMSQRSIWNSQVFVNSWCLLVPYYTWLLILDSSCKSGSMAGCALERASNCAVPGSEATNPHQSKVSSLCEGGGHLIPWTILGRMLPPFQDQCRVGANIQGCSCHGGEEPFEGQHLPCPAVFSSLQLIIL